jgi:hypothetical protein
MKPIRPHEDREGTTCTGDWGKTGWKGGHCDGDFSGKTVEQR